MASGVVHAERRRQAINSPRFSAAIFASVDSLLAALVELVSAADGAVGVTRTQSRARQLTDALKRSAAVGAINVWGVHVPWFEILIVCDQMVAVFPQASAKIDVPPRRKNTLLHLRDTLPIPSTSCASSRPSPPLAKSDATFVRRRMACNTHLIIYMYHVRIKPQ